MKFTRSPGGLQDPSASLRSPKGEPNGAVFGVTTLAPLKSLMMTTALRLPEDCAPAVTVVKRFLVARGNFGGCHLAFTAYISFPLPRNKAPQTYRLKTTPIY